jgi:Family of unknown function (DUF6510)
MTGSARWSDATTLAGPLHDLLGVEVTTAVGAAPAVGGPPRWPGCGCSTTPPAWSPAARVCDQVLLRLVRDRGRAWLDLRGLTHLQLPMAEKT